MHSSAASLPTTRTALPRSLFKEWRPREDGAVQQEMREVTRVFLNEMERQSTFFAETPLRSIAQLDPSEVQLDKRIGMGEFGVVLEVSQICLSDETDTDTLPKPHPRCIPNSKSLGAMPELLWQDENDESPASNQSTSIPKTLPEPAASSIPTAVHPIRAAGPQNRQLRRHLASTVERARSDSDLIAFTSRCHSGRPRRYAVKQIRKDLYPKKKVQAAKDLAREAKLLGRLEHPNVIRLRATVGQPGDASFMLLMDRLGTTLSEHVSEWQKRLTDAAASLVFPWQLAVSAQRKDMERAILSERLLALYDVAQAMQYLHQKSILFRDLKPENVARNHRGAFQLLDFGLAKEVKETDRVPVGDPALGMDPDILTNDDTYKLTGLTGTVRIMSPEVLQCQPYGLSADVYSFGVGIWEVFAGDRNRLSAAEVLKGERPALPQLGMPPRVVSLVKKCNGSPAFRPTFRMLCQEIEYQLLELQQQQQAFSVEDSNEQICLDAHAQIFHRFDYLRELSLQSLATTHPSNSTKNATTVE